MTVLPQWTAREVRALRGALRLSIRGLAHHLGVSDRMVSKWEAGAVLRPSNQALLDMALRQASAESRRRFALLTEQAPEALGWVLHLPLDADSADAARELAVAVCATVAGAHPAVTVGMATISPADHEYGRLHSVS